MDTALLRKSLKVRVPGTRSSFLPYLGTKFRRALPVRVPVAVLEHPTNLNLVSLDYRYVLNLVLVRTLSDPDGRPRGY
eukprot:SAG31_NODE_2297_length_5987_cov_10.665251_6_plen_78_part_00